LIQDRLRSEPRSRLVVVVSARFGETDELLAQARSIVEVPDSRTLDLLWSAGEIKSAATLALCVQALGIDAVALDVHQTGIHRGAGIEIDSESLQRTLVSHRVIVVPGFLAVDGEGAIVTLGRGGSDLSAVAIATALSADRCELIKDVPGYFSADPKTCPDAEHIPIIDFACALQMAAEGCDLVQPAALEAARRAGLTLVIRAVDDPRHTIINSQFPTSNSHGESVERISCLS
jgi:aspartate kinase